jgi:hypothetical protein
MHFELFFRIVFANRKRTLRKDEIVSKRFVLGENAYFFGPLHCGKTRERYKEGRYPENMETVTISNVSMMETNVSFYFQRDHNATTFLLDPPDMMLQPGESKVLLCMYIFANIMEVSIPTFSILEKYFPDPYVHVHVIPSFASNFSRRPFT